MHTKLPWSVDEFHNVRYPKAMKQDRVRIVGFANAGDLDDPEALANAALIVRAVNNHADLVGVLQLVLKGLEKGDIKSKPIMDFSEDAEKVEIQSLHDIVRAALTKAQS